MDEVKGLNQKLESIQSAPTGTEMLEKCVDVWGNYIPEIYSVSKALMLTKANDEAAAAAWDDVMGCLRDLCAQIIEVISKEKKLNPAWDSDKATDFFWTMISINTWEQLTHDCGWSTQEFVDETTKAIKSSLVVTQ